jgi:hypothetical protein
MNGDVICPVSVVDFSFLARVVERDGMAVAEEWNGRAWVPSTTDLAAILKAPPASPETLKRFGAA